MGLGNQILILSLYSLAVMRLTRLVNHDTVLDAVRLIPVRKVRAAQAAVAESARLGQAERAAIFGATVRRWSTVMYFLECPWCVGFWLSLATAVAPVRLIGWPWWAVIPVALAVSHLVGVLAFAAHTEDTEVVEDHA